MVRAMRVKCGDVVSHDGRCGEWMIASEVVKERSRSDMWG